MKEIDYEPGKHRLMLPTKPGDPIQLQIKDAGELEVGETIELRTTHAIALAFPGLSTIDWFLVERKSESGQAWARLTL